MWLSRFLKQTARPVLCCVVSSSRERVFIFFLRLPPDCSIGDVLVHVSDPAERSKMGKHGVFERRRRPSDDRSNEPTDVSERIQYRLQLWPTLITYLCFSRSVPIAQPVRALHCIALRRCSAASFSRSSSPPLPPPPIGILSGPVANGDPIKLITGIDKLTLIEMLSSLCSLHCVP